MSGIDGEVASPCINVCVVDPVSGLCRGCKRTLDEIARWPVMNSAEKRRVLGALALRQISGM